MRTSLTLAILAAVACCPEASAECMSRVTAADLSAETSASYAAFSDMDMAAFATHRDSARAMLPCLSESLTPADAASYLRMEGLDAFSSGDDTGATHFFQAALLVQPAWRPPSSLAPEGGPLQSLVASAAAAPPTTQAFPWLAAGHQGVANGTPGGRCPAALPCLVQVLGPDGSGAYSGLIRSWEQIPASLLAPAPQAQDWSTQEEQEERAPEKRRHPWALVGLGALSLLATPVLVKMSYDAKGEADELASRCGDPCGDREADAQISEDRSRQRTLGWSAAGTGVLAAGLGLAIMVTW